MSDAARRPHGFWIILAGNTPTSFRARTRDVLVPTFVQLQRTQPDVSLKWFERSRIWNSPDEAREALLAQKRQPRRREHPPDWRPGGDHKDPRKRFELSRDQKRARFKVRQRFGPPGTRSDPREGDRGPDRQRSDGEVAKEGPARKSWPSPPAPDRPQRPGADKPASSARWQKKPGAYQSTTRSVSRRPPARPGGGQGRPGPRKPGGGSRGPR